MGVVLITGGSKGIGYESVLRFLELGYQVITCSRDSLYWQNTVKDNPTLASVDYYSVDISNTEQVEHFFESLTLKYSQIDIAINNASPKLESSGAFSSVETHLLHATMMQDFWSHALCLKHELNFMKQGGAIVNVSSINGIRPTPNAAMYAASKHAIEGLTRSVALEATEKGIRVNAVAPGVTWTPRWQERTVDKPELKADVEKAVPLKRFAQSKEIVDAIEFLTSDKASYIIGHTLVVDGGISLA